MSSIRSYPAHRFTPYRLDDGRDLDDYCGFRDASKGGTPCALRERDHSTLCQLTIPGKVCIRMWHADDAHLWESDGTQLKGNKT